MPWTHPSFEAITQLLGERTGLCFPETRHDSAETGIRRAMARAGIESTSRYHDWIAGNAAALDDLIVELTVPETYFFREPAHFEFIRTEVLPLSRQRRGPGNRVRIWSAGCASGEEAYSLAMLLEQEKLADQTYLIATDISQSALSRARAGEYGAWSLRDEGAARAQPFLIADGKRFRVAENIKQRVNFEYFNLALDAYPSFAAGIWGMDLILCRNVLIYFDPATIRAVARRLFETLVPGGWLITASSDPPLADLAPLEMVIRDQVIFYRPKATPVHDFPVQREAAQREAAQRVSTAGKQQRTNPALALPASHGPALSPASPTLSAAELLACAKTAFSDGEYARAVELTTDLHDAVDASVLCVRALANLDLARALEACAAAVARHALSVELHFLHAVLLLDLGKCAEAVRAARRAIYLNRDLAIGHFTLGSILVRQGDLSGGRRAYRNARDLCMARPKDEELALADGERAGRLAELASAQINILDVSPEGTR